MSCPVCGLAVPEGQACPRCAPPPEPAAVADETPSGHGDALAGGSEFGYPLEFHGTAAELFPIFVRCLLFSLLTLGIYSFWARAEIRRYLMSRLELEGDRFEYHGTGRESFLGFLRVLPIFLFAIVAPFALFLVSDGGRLQTLGLLGFYAGLLASLPAAIALSWRYRVSRTSWRGVRFSWRGSLGRVYEAAARGGLFTLFTLGICYPLLQEGLRRELIGQTWFGNRRFTYHANSAELAWPRFWAALLTYPSLGICWFWYWARERRHILEATEFSGRRFWTELTGGELFKLGVPNGLILILTLGLGWPLTAVRSWRVMARNFLYDADLDLSGIVQDARTASAAGDVLEGMVDADVTGLDFGL